MTTLGFRGYKISKLGLKKLLQKLLQKLGLSQKLLQKLGVKKLEKNFKVRVIILKVRVKEVRVKEVR